MRMVVCAIYDLKADQFAPPFCTRTEGEAIRMFTDVVNKPGEENLWYLHPDDFVLFALGNFETDTGKYELLDSERKLLAGNEAKQVVESPRLKGVI